MLLNKKVHEHIGVPLPVLDKIVQVQLPHRQVEVAAPLIPSAARRSDGDQALPRAAGSLPAAPPDALCDLHFPQWLRRVGVVFGRKLRAHGEGSAPGAAAASAA